MEELKESKESKECQECEEQKALKKKEMEKEIKGSDGLAHDWLGRYNVFTRVMVIAITGIFIYAFMVPLPIAYAETASYILLFALMIITFGLNSLKILGTLIDKWKK